MPTEGVPEELLQLRFYEEDKNYFCILKDFGIINKIKGWIKIKFNFQFC
ncbi:MAG TPA: hypothetical protein PKZ94_01290 [Candidatus Pacearchaeota archaeon]|jgi:hypothetical protein|nr:hypothetical protein [Candidatus Pacearchaeota archaeon]